MKKILLVCLVVGILQAKELHVLIKMIPAQEKHFRENIAKEFEVKTGCKIKVNTFGDNWDLAKKLGATQAVVDVVKVPMGMADYLVSKCLVKPVQDVAGSGLGAIMKQYFLVNLATIGGKVCYLPRKFETRIMVYLKSRVREAATGWAAQQGEVEKALNKSTGKGLPAGYKLESDPSKWDYYDLFVAGFYWAQKEYAGKKAGRIAHRDKDYSGTAVGLIDRCFQMGAKQAEITQVKTPAYQKVLVWESLYAHHGIYPKEMWEQGWSGVGLWEAFGRGDIFLSFLTQIDCYFLHGTDLEGMKGYAKSPADLGYALMPQAVDLATGVSLKRSISTGGWLWGIGGNTQDAALALEFIQYLTNYQNQVSECDIFGIIPVRKDILGKTNLIFSRKWKAEVYKTSLMQLRANGRAALPFSSDFEKTEKEYLAVWRAVVEGSADKALKPEEILKLY